MKHEEMIAVIRAHGDGKDIQAKQQCTIDYKHELGDLLAIIHRDGGHYISDHGMRKAIEEAKEIMVKCLLKPKE